jgi:hypothetical protein
MLSASLIKFLLKVLKGKTPYEVIHGNLYDLAYLVAKSVIHGSYNTYHSCKYVFS